MKTQEEIEQLTNDLYLQKTEAIANIDIRGYIVSATKGGFIDGYIQCQKDMADKKYTEKDMRKVFEYGKTLEPFDCFEDFINSLNKQD